MSLLLLLNNGVLPAAENNAILVENGFGLLLESGPDNYITTEHVSESVFVTPSTVTTSGAVQTATVVVTVPGAGDPPVVESTTTAVGDWQSDVIVDKPSGVTIGDRIVIVVNAMNYDGSAIDASITGFTKRAETTSTGYVRVQIFDKVANGTEGDTFTVTRESGWAYANVHVLRVSGVHPTSPVDVSAVVDSAGAYAVDHKIPSVVTTESNTLLIAGHYQQADDLVSAPGGWTGSSVNSNSGSQSWLFYREFAAGGSSGDTTLVTTPDSDRWATAVLAYRSSSIPVITLVNPSTYSGSGTYPSSGLSFSGRGFALTVDGSSELYSTTVPSYPGTDLYPDTTIYPYSDQLMQVLISSRAIIVGYSSTFSIPVPGFSTTSILSLSTHSSSGTAGVSVVSASSIPLVSTYGSSYVIDNIAFTISGQLNASSILSTGNVQGYVLVAGSNINGSTYLTTTSIDTANATQSILHSQPTFNGTNSIPDPIEGGSVVLAASTFNSTFILDSHGFTIPGNAVYSTHNAVVSFDIPSMIGSAFVAASGYGGTGAVQSLSVIISINQTAFPVAYDGLSIVYSPLSLLSTAVIPGSEYLGTVSFGSQVISTTGVVSASMFATYPTFSSPIISATATSIQSLVSLTSNLDVVLITSSPIVNGIDYLSGFSFGSSNFTISGNALSDTGIFDGVVYSAATPYFPDINLYPENTLYPNDDEFLSLLISSTATPLNYLSSFTLLLPAFGATTTISQTNILGSAVIYDPLEGSSANVAHSVYQSSYIINTTQFAISNSYTTNTYSGSVSIAVPSINWSSSFIGSDFAGSLVVDGVVISSTAVSAVSLISSTSLIGVVSSYTSAFVVGTTYSVVVDVNDVLNISADGNVVSVTSESFASYVFGGFNISGQVSGDTHIAESSLYTTTIPHYPDIDIYPGDTLYPYSDEVVFLRISSTAVVSELSTSFVIPVISVDSGALVNPSLVFANGIVYIPLNISSVSVIHVMHQGSYSIDQAQISSDTRYTPTVLLGTGTLQSYTLTAQSILSSSTYTSIGYVDSITLMHDSVALSGLLQSSLELSNVVINSSVTSITSTSIFGFILDPVSFSISSGSTPSTYVGIGISTSALQYTYPDLDLYPDENLYPNYSDNLLSILISSTSIAIQLNASSALYEPSLNTTALTASMVISGTTVIYNPSNVSSSIVAPISHITSYLLENAPILQAVPNVLPLSILSESIVYTSIGIGSANVLPFTYVGDYIIDTASISSSSMVITDGHIITYRLNDPDNVSASATRIVNTIDTTSDFGVPLGFMSILTNPLSIIGTYEVDNTFSISITGIVQGVSYSGLVSFMSTLMYSTALANVITYSGSVIFDSSLIRSSTLIIYNSATGMGFIYLPQLGESYSVSSSTYDGQAIISAPTYTLTALAQVDSVYASYDISVPEFSMSYVIDVNSVDVNGSVEVSTFSISNSAALNTVAISCVIDNPNGIVAVYALGSSVVGTSDFESVIFSISESAVVNTYDGIYQLLLPSISSGTRLIVEQIYGYTAYMSSDVQISGVAQLVVVDVIGTVPLAEFAWNSSVYSDLLSSTLVIGSPEFSLTSSITPISDTFIGILIAPTINDATSVYYDGLGTSIILTLPAINRTASVISETYISDLTVGTISILKSSTVAISIASPFVGYVDTVNVSGQLIIDQSTSLYLGQVYGVSFALSSTPMIVTIDTTFSIWADLKVSSRVLTSVVDGVMEFGVLVLHRDRIIYPSTLFVTGKVNISYFVKFFKGSRKVIALAGYEIVGKRNVVQSTSGMSIVDAASKIVSGISEINGNQSQISSGISIFDGNFSRITSETIGIDGGQVKLDSEMSITSHSSNNILSGTVELDGSQSDVESSWDKILDNEENVHPTDDILDHPDNDYRNSYGFIKK